VNYDTFDAYPGSITDPKQVEVSGFLDLLDEGIDVMVDKGLAASFDAKRAAQAT